MSRQSSPGASADNPESSPLSAEELEAINALAKGGLNQEQIAQDAATAANALAEAVQVDGKVVANTDEEYSRTALNSRLSEDEDGYVDLTSIADEMDKEDDNDDEEWLEVVANSENHGCRAKDPQKCRIHGGYWHPAVMNPLNDQEGGTDAEALGLEQLADIPGDNLTARITVKDAREAMSGKGLKVKTMEGDFIVLDQETARHVEKDHPRHKKGTNLTEGQDRMQKLLDVVRAIRKPHEIWQELDENGEPSAKLYMRVYKLTDGKRVTLGVQWEKEGGRLHTFYDTDKPAKLERKRKGKLLYKRISEGRDKKES